MKDGGKVGAKECEGNVGNDGDDDDGDEKGEGNDPNARARPGSPRKRDKCWLGTPITATSVHSNGASY